MFGLVGGHLTWSAAILPGRRPSYLVGGHLTWSAAILPGRRPSYLDRLPMLPEHVDADDRVVELRVAGLDQLVIQVLLETPVKQRPV